MAIKQRVKEENTNEDFELLDAGEYEGRLAYVADLGVQEGMEWKGVKKADRQQLSLGLELIGKTVTIDGNEQPQIMWTSPFNIFGNLLDLGKELPLYKTFETGAKEGDTADWDTQLGKPCNVMIEHRQGKGDNSGNTYANIGSITPIPAKYQSEVEPMATSDSCTGDADNDQNPAQLALYGLAAYVYGRRIDGSEPTSDNPYAD